MKVPAQAVANPSAQQRPQAPAQRPAKSASQTPSSANAQKLQIKCKCGTVLALSRDLVGKNVACPKCKQTFVVPAPKTQPQPQQRQQLKPTKPASKQPAPAASLAADDPLGLGSLGAPPQPMPSFGPLDQPASFPAPMQSAPFQPYQPPSGAFAGPRGHSGSARPFNFKRTGLLITAIGLWMVLGGYLITGIGILAAGSGPTFLQNENIQRRDVVISSPSMELSSVIFTISQIFALLAGIVLAGGYSFCGVPPGAGRAVIIAAVVVCAISLLLALVAFILGQAYYGLGTLIAAIIAYLVQICLAVHLFLAATFVSKIGYEVDHRGQRKGRGGRSPLAVASSILFAIYGGYWVLVIPFGALVGYMFGTQSSISTRSLAAAGIGMILLGLLYLLVLLGLFVGIVLLSIGCMLGMKRVPTEERVVH